MNREQRRLGVMAGLIAILVALASPLAAAAEPDIGSCVLSELEPHPVYKILESNPSYRQSLIKFRKLLCSLVEGKRTDWTAAGLAEFRKKSTRRKLADQVWKSLLSFHYFCRPEFNNELQKASTPETVQNVVFKYCDDYGDTIKVANLDLSEEPEDNDDGKLSNIESLQKLQQRFIWLLQEMFCQISEYVASPGGWQGVLEPDLPAVHRLKKSAESLCDGVRNGAITLDEAGYRWRQELLRLERRLGPEAASEAIGQLPGILEKLVK